MTEGWIETNLNLKQITFINGKMSGREDTINIKKLLFGQLAASKISSQKLVIKTVSMILIELLD